MKPGPLRMSADAGDPAPLAAHDAVLAQAIDSAFACWSTPGLAVVVVRVGHGGLSR